MKREMCDEEQAKNATGGKAVELSKEDKGYSTRGNNNDRPPCILKLYRLIIGIKYPFWMKCNALFIYHLVREYPEYSADVEQYPSTDQSSILPPPSFLLFASIHKGSYPPDTF